MKLVGVNVLENKVKVKQTDKDKGQESNSVEKFQMLQFVSIPKIFYFVTLFQNHIEANSSHHHRIEIFHGPKFETELKNHLQNTWHILDQFIT